MNPQDFDLPLTTHEIGNMERRMKLQRQREAVNRFRNNGDLNEFSKEQENGNVDVDFNC